MGLFDELKYIQEQPWFWSFSDEKIISVERFMLFWSRFEDKIFNKNFSLSDVDVKLIPQMVVFFKENNQKLIFVLEYFQRFFKDGNDIPYNICWKYSERKKYEEWIIYIKSIDLNNKLEDEDIEASCSHLMFFIYRMRNNLFHWIKHIEELERQNQLFHYANYFLSLSLDAYFNQIS